MPIPAARQRVVLAALLLRANRVVLVDELVDLLWGESAPPTAPMMMVQNYVKRLRQALRAAGKCPILTRLGGYLIEIGAEELDIMLFEALQGQAREAVRGCDCRWRRAGCSGRWRCGAERRLSMCRVIDWWDGRYRGWVRCGCRRWKPGAEADLHLGRHGEVLGELAQLVGAYPLRQRLRALLMLAVPGGTSWGRSRRLPGGRQVLACELGVEPGPGLHRLHQQILTADPGLAI